MQLPMRFTRRAWTTFSLAFGLTCATALAQDTLRCQLLDTLGSAALLGDDADASLEFPARIGRAATAYRAAGERWSDVPIASVALSARVLQY